MLDDLQPAIRIAIMSILAAVYESGTVDEVAVADVMRLFGAELPPNAPPSRFSFNDEGWIEAYIDFREANDADLVDVQMDFGLGPLEDFDDLPEEPNHATNKKLH